MLKELGKFKIRYGHCRVPWNFSDNVKLAQWVSTQRTMRNRGKLSPERIERLDGLGFDWEPFKNQWDEMYKRLARYRERFGNCDVPYNWEEDPELGSWVQTQRRRKDGLSSRRIRELEELGMRW